MKKVKRRQRILELISTNNIDTQQQLTEMLLKEGFDATQATISRDIKELHLHKIALDNGGYKYICKQSTDAIEMSSAFDELLNKAVISVERTSVLVVVKTYAGMAQAICAAMDSMNVPNALGSIAGEDTIFIAMRSESAAEEICNMLNKKHQ